MIALIQRVSGASVAVDGKVVGECGKGFLILLGVINGDSEEDCEILSEKIRKLRIFEDENGKMNRSIFDVGGDALVISQFTLGADCTHGNRPDFLASAPREISEPLYENFTSKMREKIDGKVEAGIFGADMKVSLVNDGPVTIILDSEKLKRKK